MKNDYIRKKSNFGQVAYSQSPFCHGIMKHFKNDHNKELAQWLFNFKKWKLSKTKYYENWEYAVPPKEDINECKDFFGNENLLEIKKLFELTFDKKFYDFIKFGAHKLTQGQKLGIHNDHAGPLFETHRMVMHFNEGWDDKKGGLLVFLNSYNIEDVYSSFKPINNSAVLFECSANAYHAVTEVKSGERFSFVASAWEIDNKNYEKMIINEYKERLFFLKTMLA